MLSPVELPYAEEISVPRPTWLPLDIKPESARCGPLGADSDYVFCEGLGLSGSEVETLKMEGVIS